MAQMEEESDDDIMLVKEIPVKEDHLAEFLQLMKKPKLEGVALAVGQPTATGVVRALIKTAPWRAVSAQSKFLCDPEVLKT